MHHHIVETHPNISPLTIKHECANTPASHLPWHTNQQNRQRVLSYSSNANVFTTPTHTTHNIKTDTYTDRHTDTQTHRSQVNTSKNGPQARGWAIRLSRQIARCREPKQELNLYSPVEAPRRGEGLGRQPVVPKQVVSVARSRLQVPSIVRSGM